MMRNCCWKAKMTSFVVAKCDKWSKCFFECILGHKLNWFSTVSWVLGSFARKMARITNHGLLIPQFECTWLSTFLIVFRKIKAYLCRNSVFVWLMNVFVKSAIAIVKYIQHLRDIYWVFLDCTFLYTCKYYLLKNTSKYKCSIKHYSIGSLLYEIEDKFPVKSQKVADFLGDSISGRYNEVILSLLLYSLHN